MSAADAYRLPPPSHREKKLVNMTGTADGADAVASADTRWLCDFDDT